MDHDRLFKQLLTTFFTDFLQLLFPQVLEYLDRTSIEFLDKEVFTDIAAGDRHEVDLLTQPSHNSKIFATQTDMAQCAARINSPNASSADLPS